MKSPYKLKLLAGTSAVAIGLAAAFAPSAQAFDKVNWTWNAHINENIDKQVRIRIDLDPTGMVMLEDLQVFIGDVTADSTVYGVYNNQPASTGGDVEIALGTIDWTLNRTGNTTDLGVDHTFDPSQTGVVSYTGDTGINFQHSGAGNFDAGNSFDLGSIVVTVQPSDTFDALTELPEVVSAATAVANNTSIESDASVQLHEGQFVFGDGDLDDRNDSLAVLGATLFAANAADAGVNSNLIGAGVLGILAIAQAIDPAQISATSNVYDILNATVDSSATAVANNLTVDVSATGDDRLVIGDVVQFAYADVSASSTVSNVRLHNYTNLGALDRPIVNSVATAVGNNKSITVSAPSVSVAP